MLTKYQNHLWDCAKNLEQAGTKDASSKRLEEKIGPIGNISPCHGQQNLVYYYHEQLPPDLCCARQEAIDGLAGNRRCFEIQYFKLWRMASMVYAIGYKAGILAQRTALS
ncbi:hypothetical protein FH972_000565 [Carpinus fangiana]|uniref:Uncharacterized protein n=1 Tax=Carpinus fangiana TaxID=176857 RepID=A0A5N6Q975_9ROSI|nr:hypothetical protein FH972_000565 [Carpinus fangiana]